MLDENKLLFDELYEKTRNFGRVQFVKLLMAKEREIKELKKQLEDLFNENSKLRKKLEKSMTFQDYEHTLNKKIQLENQQKEFIEWLENKIKYWEEQEQQWLNLGFMKFGGEANNKIIFKKILSKYKEIIGVKDE